MALSSVTLFNTLGRKLVPLEPKHGERGRTMPTAVFYVAEGKDLHTLPKLYGRAAIAAYVDGTDGRLMRSMKSVLGSALMEQHTDIGAGRSVAFGDVMHSAFQVVHPQLKVLGDADPDRARQSRFAIVTELAATNKIGYGCHFADVVFGHVRHTGKTMAWIPMP